MTHLEKYGAVCNLDLTLLADKLFEYMLLFMRLAANILYSVSAAVMHLIETRDILHPAQRALQLTKHLSMCRSCSLHSLAKQVICISLNIAYSRRVCFRGL